MFYVWFWKWLVKYFEEKQKTRKVKLQTITEVPEIVESTLLEGPGTYQGGNCEKPNLQEREKLKKKKDAMKKSRNFLSSEQDILKELGCSSDDEGIPATPQPKNKVGRPRRQGRTSASATRQFYDPPEQVVTTPTRRNRINI